MERSAWRPTTERIPSVQFRERTMSLRFFVGACAVSLSLAWSTPSQAGWWYLGKHHDDHYNCRFLQRPYQPYHGWNRPFYGWSSNYRPYYFTPQSYANTPWNYGPEYQQSVYNEAAPPQGLNSYGVPVQNTSATKSVPIMPQAPTVAPTPAAVPTPAVPPVPEIPQPPQPSIVPSP